MEFLDSSLLETNTSSTILIPKNKSLKKNVSKCIKINFKGT